MMKLSLHVLSDVHFDVDVDVKHDSPYTLLPPLKFITIFNLLLYFLCDLRFVGFILRLRPTSKCDNKTFACCYYRLRKISNLFSNKFFLLFICESFVNCRKKGTKYEFNVVNRHKMKIHAHRYVKDAKEEGKKVYFYWNGFSCKRTNSMNNEAQPAISIYWYDVSR